MCRSFKRASFHIYHRCANFWQTGLFSVPAPPFRLPRSAGFFIGLIPHPTLDEMPLPTIPPDIWSSEANRAQLTLSGIEGSLDLSRPWTGLSHLHIERISIPQTALFQVRSNPGTDVETIIDRYTRGRDLVVRYSQTAARPVSLELYWRGFVTDDVSGIDQIVSTQTDQLDSDPTIVIEHQLPPGTTVAYDTASAGVLYRPEAGSYSWLLAAHPADCEGLTVMTEEDGTSVAFRIFRPRLEKGVIHRARLRAALLTRKADIDAAQHCEQAFLDAALPLTS